MPPRTAHLPRVNRAAPQPTPDAVPPGLSTPDRPPPAGTGPWLPGIFLLLVLAALYLAVDIIAPITIAVMLNLLLGPLVGRMRGIGLPEPLGAGLVVLALVGAVAVAGMLLSGPASEWMARAPETLGELEGKLRSFRSDVADMAAATRQVERLADAAAGGTSVPTVAVQGETLGSMLLSGTSQLVAQALIVVFLLYFLLAAGNTFLRRLVQALPDRSGKRRAVEITHAVQHDVSAYLITVTAINTVLGVVTAGTMAVLGMPNPVLWGVVAGVFNFVPYVGAIATLVILAVVALLTFDSITWVLLPPLLFLAFTALEGNLITPTVLGRRFALSPALVFLSLVFWSWMWGVAGAALSAPLLVTLKSIAEHEPRLLGLATFLGRRDGPPPP